MDRLLQRLEALEDEVRTLQRRLRLWRQLAGSVLVLALVTLLQPWAIAVQAPGGKPGPQLLATREPVATCERPRAQAHACHECDRGRGAA
jgi:hypothetical protein